MCIYAQTVDTLVPDSFSITSGEIFLKTYLSIVKIILIFGLIRLGIISFPFKGICGPSGMAAGGFILFMLIHVDHISNRMKYLTQTRKNSKYFICDTRYYV